MIRNGKRPYPNRTEDMLHNHLAAWGLIAKRGLPHDEHIKEREAIVRNIVEHLKRLGNIYES